MSNTDRRRVIFKCIFYTLTLICLGLSVWALRYAYIYLNIPLWSWILLYIAIAAYLVVAAALTAKQRAGFHRFATHSLLLQIAPLCASILTFNLVSDQTIYTPITGETRQYERHFNDMQRVQKASAEANGLAPFESREELERRYNRLRREDRLTKLESNSMYKLRNLTHSAPYVVPKVEELLNDIGELFQEYSQSKSGFIVTSVLRTKDDVKRLRKRNVNASLSSCHCNATTIDISYARFTPDKYRTRSLYDLRKALAKSLYELRKDGRCYVKIERKQYCYHITVR